MQSPLSEDATHGLGPDDVPDDCPHGTGCEGPIPAPFGRGGLHETTGTVIPAVWVQAAITCDAQRRAALKVEEWALESVVDSDEVVLSFLMSDGSVQSVLLSEVDAQDMAIAVQRTRRTRANVMN